MLRHRRRVHLLAATALAATVMVSPGAPAASADPTPLVFSVLVFSKTAGERSEQSNTALSPRDEATGSRHDSIPAGIAAIQQLGTQNGFTVEATEDATAFTDANLSRFAAVVWLSTTGDVLNTDQQAAFERYIRAGGGYAGIHAAADTEYDWAWYGRLVGAYFASHPANQQATVKVEDPAHPSTAATPVVYVHHRPRGSATRLIAADNRAAVTTAVAHLRAHGHDRIDFLAGPRGDDGPFATRVAAWRSAATGRLLHCACSRAAAVELIGGLATVPRALVTASDEHAIGVLAAAHTAGIDVPGRLAVISCDGTPDAEFTAPALTATEQPLDLIARQAVRQLLGEPGKPEPIRARLVTRRSCGCPHPPPAR